MVDSISCLTVVHALARWSQLFSDEGTGVTQGDGEAVSVVGIRETAVSEQKLRIGALFAMDEAVLPHFHPPYIVMPHLLAVTVGFHAGVLRDSEGIKVVARGDVLGSGASRFASFSPYLILSPRAPRRLNMFQICSPIDQDFHLARSDEAGLRYGFRFAGLSTG